MDSIDDIFGEFKRWETGKKKKNIKSKTLGLLFDYYLLEFEDNKENNEHNIKFLRKQFEIFKDEVIPSKTERVSYYQQLARFLKWFSDRYKTTGKNLYLDQIKQLYEALKTYLLSGKESTDGPNYRVKLEDFDKYDYDRYTESLEKFYRNLTFSGFNNYIEDEKNFLNSLNEYERENFLLYRFKELERQQRIGRLNNKTFGCTRKDLKCFNVEDSIAFDGILKCAKKVKNKNCDEDLKFFNTGLRPIGSTEYEIIMERENDHFLDRLKYRSRHPIYRNSKRTYHFMGLQRWNSQTPTLTLSQGGGYLLYEQDDRGKVILGIAIDPGFDFVDNLFNMGFTLNDIDFILLSHAHLDHIRDFEPIVSSLLDLKKREQGSRKRIHAMMTLGVYHHLEHVITNTTLREFLADTFIIDIDKEIDNGKNLKPFMFKMSEDGNVFQSIIPGKDDEKEKCVVIEPKLVYHNDYSERSDSFGYVIRFYNNRKPIVSFGYTADTRWDDDIPAKYSDCEAICIHLGALIESDQKEKNTFDYYDESGQHCDDLVEKKWHPYLFGMLRFLKAIKKNNKNKLVLISEFGEEMKGGIRIDFTRRLDRLLNINADNRRPCIPVDISLNVILARQSKDSNKNKPWETDQYPIWCFGCERFVKAEKIGYRHLDTDVTKPFFISVIPV
ncbi:MAG: MBL fold metallo-hydrolase [Deltaproteobacteria bacterium]|nr:MBL fold metallo-hydrolase [Deltaproteobacteria bacterium]